MWGRGLRVVVLLAFRRVRAWRLDLRTRRRWTKKMVQRSLRFWLQVQESFQGIVSPLFEEQAVYSLHPLMLSGRLARGCHARVAAGCRLHDLQNLMQSHRQRCRLVFCRPLR